MRGVGQALAVLVAFSAQLAWAGAESVSDEPVVTERIAADEVLLGTAFVAEFSVSHSESMSFDWPINFVLPPMLEVLEHHRESWVDKGRKRTQLRLTLVALDTGVMTIPSQELLFEPGEPGREGESEIVFSDKLSFEVQSLIPSGKPEIRPLLAPRANWAHNSLWKWKLGGMGLLLLAAGFWIVRRPRQSNGASVEKRLPIVVSPAAQAYAAFQKLEESEAISQSSGANVYLLMSEILRRYLGRRFGIPALDLTSSEIRSRLSSVEDSHIWIRSLDEWLGNSDLVKFAGQPVSQEEIRQSLQAARILVDRSKEVSRAPREIARA